ncbi:DUF1642 domain-containing protein [Streptococcus mitis]|uniref:DUF1642 domain-containing protein n=1 Tax=Streptococcus mitis TaxID=28037 RepID=UPI0039F02453
MKLNELIEKYKRYEGNWNNKTGELARQIFLEDLKQLDEPQKVKVPQFVDDVIEGAREHSPELEDALHYACSNGSQEFTEWYQKKSNRDLFARAWLDGYEVEEEKRYFVKLKGEIKENKLVYGLGIERYFFAKSYDSSKRGKHTRKELEAAGFGWVFDCPGIEVEEVE